MDNLPSYRVDSGQVRILFGLTMVDIIVIIGIWMTIYMLWSSRLTLVLGLLAARGVISLSRALKRLIPSYAPRHFVGWLGQATFYLPGPDPEPTPIFPQEDV